MSVIEVLSGKGGAGKTQTLRNLVGMHILEGGTCGIIDADPSRSLTDWVLETFKDYQVLEEAILEEGEDPVPVHCKGGGFELISGPKPNDVRQLISDLDEKHGLVLVDTPGLNADMQQIVASVADLVILPSNSTSDDFKAAVKGEKLVNRVRNLAQHTILSTVLLNQINEQSNSAAVVRGWFEEAGIHVLQAQIPYYEVFKLCSFNGGIPFKDKPGEKVEALYREVIQLLSSIEIKEAVNG